MAYSLGGRLFDNRHQAIEYLVLCLGQNPHPHHHQQQHLFQQHQHHSSYHHEHQLQQQQQQQLLSYQQRMLASNKPTTSFLISDILGGCDETAAAAAAGLGGGRKLNGDDRFRRVPSVIASYSKHRVKRPWDSDTSNKTTESDEEDGRDDDDDEEEEEDEEIEVDVIRTPSSAASTNTCPLNALYKMTNKTFNETDSISSEDQFGKSTVIYLFFYFLPAKRYKCYDMLHNNAQWRTLTEP